MGVQMLNILLTGKSNDRIQEYRAFFSPEVRIFLLYEGSDTSSIDKIVLENTVLITDVFEYVNKYWENGDLLVLDSTFSAFCTPRFLKSLQEAAYLSNEVGAVSPLLNANIQKEIVCRGLTPLIFNDGQYFGCLLLKECVIRILASSTIWSDFLFYKDKIGYKLTQLGYKHAICPACGIPMPARFQHTYICNTDTLKKELYNQELFASLNNGRKNILYLIQADFRPDSSNHIGGTQLHVKDLVVHQRNYFNVFVAARNSDSLQVTAYLPDKVHTFRFYIGAQEKYPQFFSHAFERIYKNILSAFRIDLLHIHHIYGMSMDIFEIATRQRIPVIITLHDFYYLCPTIKMFSNDNTCCVGSDTEEMCHKCLKEYMDISESLPYISNWRSYSRYCLKACNCIITPSQNTKDIYAMYFPELSEKIKVIPHGYDVQNNFNIRHLKPITDSGIYQYNIEKAEQKDNTCIRVEGWARVLNRDNAHLRTFLKILLPQNQFRYVPTEKLDRDDVATGNYLYRKTGFVGYIPKSEMENSEWSYQVVVCSEEHIYELGQFHTVQCRTSENNGLNVAFIGGLSPAKGSKRIFQIVTQGPTDVNWFIFGGIDDGELHNLKQKNLVKTGFYERDELKMYLDLHHIDVICILSLWPETFCYTLSEAVGYHRPVIVTDIGALGNRVKNMKCGWTVSADNAAEETLSIIKRIKDRGKEYSSVLNTVKKLHLKTVSEMNNEYSALYNELISGTFQEKPYESEFIFNSWLQPKEELPHSINEEEYQRYILSLEEELQNIKGSRSYTLAKAISKIWGRLQGNLHRKG